MWHQELNPLWGSILVAIPDFCYIDSVRFSFGAVLSFDTSIATFEVILIIRFWASCEGEGSGLWRGISFPLNLPCHFLQSPYRGSILLSPEGGRQASPELSFILFFLFF